MATSKSRAARTANPELAASMRELRRSSAAAPHEVKSRKGSRAVRKQAAVKDFS
jgi:hypothetical protein